MLNSYTWEENKSIAICLCVHKLYFSHLFYNFKGHNLVMHLWVWPCSIATEVLNIYKHLTIAKVWWSSEITWRFYWLSNFFSVRLLSVLRGHSVFFIPATTANDLRLRRIFYPRFYPLHLCSYLNSWERARIFTFECSVQHKGTTWYHFYNVFDMTRSLTGDWTWDLPHSKPALYH